jgi:hypothetical protein
MVIGIVESFELLICQVGDEAWIAARVQTVGVTRKERFGAVLGQQPLWRRICALHLIENHTLIGQGCILAFQFVVPALLLQRVRRDERVQHRIHVNVHQVIEILQILAGNRVTGLIRIRECIDKRSQRALH